MSIAIRVYEHEHFKGKSRDVIVGEYPSVSSIIGNDKISSLRVMAGYYVRIYADSGFRGRNIPLFQGNYDDIPNWNDRISSIKVFKHDTYVFPLIQFYTNSNFGGQHQTLAATGPETGYNQPFFDNDSISSIIVPAGAKVILFADVDYKGSKTEFEPGVYPNLKTYGWNDKVSSVKLLAPTLELVKIEYLEEISLPNGAPIALSDATQNASDFPQKSTLKLSRQITESSTRSWSNSTMVGLSISNTVTAGVDTGVLSAQVSTTITATLENTFTIGEEETKSETFTFEKIVEVDVPPHSIGKATLMLTPERYQVKVRYTFQVAGTDKQVTEDALIMVEAYSRGEATITIDPIAAIA